MKGRGWCDGFTDVILGRRYVQTTMEGAWLSWERVSMTVTVTSLSSEARYVATGPVPPSS